MGTIERGNPEVSRKMESAHTRGSVLGAIVGAAVALLFVFLVHTLYIEATLMASRGLLQPVRITVRTLTAYSSWLVVIVLGGLGGLLIGYKWSKSVNGSSRTSASTMSGME